MTYTETIDIPEMDGKKGYIASIFNSRAQLRQILTIPELGKNPMGLYWMIKIIIQDEIRDEKLRTKIISDLDKNIKDRVDKIKKETNQEIDRETYNHFVIDEAISALGACTTYNDKYLNIGVENKIQVSKLECVNCKYRLESGEEDE